ncbi:MAG: MlaD family protein [Candidatus Omnitrophota bacterium]
MIFGKTKLELKVGVFVFIGLIILAVFILSLGGFKTWTSGYRVNFSFGFINGVKIGAPVRFAGMDVGEVKDIHFVFVPQEDKTKVIVDCWVKREVRIPLDSTIWVNTLGLLGEKYIEIMPGKDYNKTLGPNEELLGQDPVPMNQITELAKRIIRNIDECIIKIKNQEGTLGKLLYNDTVYDQLEALVTDLRYNPWKLLWKGEERQLPPQAAEKPAAAAAENKNEDKK